MIQNVESIVQSMEVKIPFDGQIFTLLAEADSGNEFLLESINYASYSKHASKKALTGNMSFLLFTIIN
jgi:hypothetical protein